MAQGIPERLVGLARQSATTGIGNGAGDHHRPAPVLLLKKLRNGKQGGLGVEGVKHRLHQQNIRTALNQGSGGLGIGFYQLIKTNVTKPRVVHIWRDRSGAISRPEHTSHKPGPVWVFCLHGVGGFAGQPGGFTVDVGHLGLHAVVSHGNRGAIKGVGLKNIRTGLQVGGVNRFDNVRLGQAQQVIVALQVTRPIGKFLAPIVGLLQLIALNHGAHGTVEQQNTVGELLFEQVVAQGAIHRLNRFYIG